MTSSCQVITGLLGAHGQGGPCSDTLPDFSYHNSFLVLDPGEAWVLETAGTLWVAEKVEAGVRNISNCLRFKLPHLSSAQCAMTRSQRDDQDGPVERGAAGHGPGPRLVGRGGRLQLGRGDVRAEAGQPRQPRHQVALRR